MTLTQIPASNTFGALYLNRVEWWQFQVQFELARLNHEQIREATSPFEPDPTGETFYWLAADGMSGFAINYRGEATGELLYVFSRVRGRGDDIVKAATDRGAVFLDCFDGYLTELYARHGFEQWQRVANWTPGGPDVVYMVRADFVYSAR